jgi:cytochrome c-type biogenesis protein CcmH
VASYRFALPVVAALTLALAPQADEAAREREAKQIETLLVAPCCWLQQVSEHQSEAADQVRAEIRVLLASGKTRQQVLDAFVAEYGPRILVVPPARGFGAWLYVLPPGIFVLSGLGLFLVVRRMRARRDQAVRADATTPVAPIADQDLARLEDELEGLD